MDKLNFPTHKYWSLGILFAGLLILSACSDGIDRGSERNSDNNSQISFDDDSPADISYVKLDLLDDTSEQPSVISVLFTAKDKNNTPADNLAITDFEIREDGNLLPASESATTLLPREFWPFYMDTVVLLDISSSISASDLANMKQAVMELVRDSTTGNSRLFSGQRVAIYTFDDSVRQVKGSSSSPNHIIDSLDTITLPLAITPTDLYGAVNTAVELWQTAQSITNIHDGAVILITDGTDTAGRRSLSSTLKSIGDKKVFTVGVGEDINEDVLEDLGTADSFTVNDFAELSPALSSIREKLRRFADSYYYLQYASPKRAADGKISNSDHTFEVRVAENKNKGSSRKISGKFNSHDFSNVLPRVMIGGSAALESSQSVSYLAQTFWSFQESVYNWQISGNCTLNSNEGNKISLTATNPGSCQLSVSDTANNGVVTNKSISVSGD